MTYESLFSNPMGRTSRSHFVAALITLLAAILLYSWYVKGRTGQWCILVLLYPAIVLHARRLHDMGKTAWLLIAPGALIAAAIYLRMVQRGTQMEVAVTGAALVLCAAFALWGLVGNGQAEANKFGDPAAA